MANFQITEETINELSKYFDILQKHTEETIKNKNFNVNALEIELNTYLEVLSKKYNEDFLWYTMKKANNEKLFFVASAVLYRKHNLIVKVVKHEDGQAMLTFVESEKDLANPY